jgi:hypothetical protein
MAESGSPQTASSATQSSVRRFSATLASISFECWPKPFRELRLVEELPQLFQLAVGECVHRIDNNRPRPWGLACDSSFYRGIYNGNEEAERFTGSSSSRDDRALPRGCLRKGLRLVAMKSDRLASYPKYLACIRMQRAVRDQRVDCNVAREIWIDTD